MKSYYDWIKRNGRYDYSKKGYLTNYTTLLK